MPPRTTDAVIFVPGILGSELTLNGKTIWGLDLVAYSAANFSDDLLMTDQDREYAADPLNPDLEPRVLPEGLLRKPAYYPGIGTFGWRGYSPMIEALNRHLGRGEWEAVPYDWRLDVKCNGKLLQRKAREYLTRWREKQPDAQLCLVGHSMGGLVIHEAIAGGLADVRRVIMLGTPHHGSVDALRSMVDGAHKAIKWAPQARRLSRDLPGCYDLLPGFGCVQTAVGLEPLTAELLAPLGGTRKLFEEAAARRRSRARTPLPNHIQIHGNQNRTVVSVGFRNGVARFESKPRGGDGTVPIDSALLSGRANNGQIVSSSQNHLGLAIHQSVLSRLPYALRGDELPPTLAAGDSLSIDAPEVARTGTEVIVDVRGAEGITVASTEVTTRENGVWRSYGRTDDGAIRYRCTGLRQGMHEVVASGGGGAQTSTLIVVANEMEGD